MSKVILWPSMKVLDVDSDQSLLEQLKDAGHTIKSECGGHASCGQCIVKVHSGEEHLSPPEFKELKLLGNVFHLTKERLSCQTHITGDVTIDISQHTSITASSHSKKKFQRLKSSKKNILKKGEQLKTEAMNLSRQEVEGQGDVPKKDADWFRHWEKETKEEKDTPKGKRLDGNERPRMFKSPEGATMTIKSKPDTVKPAVSKKDQTKKE